MPEPIQADLSILRIDDIPKVLRLFKKADEKSNSRDVKNLLALGMGYLNFRKGDYKTSIHFLRERILGNFILDDLRLHFEANALRKMAVELFARKKYLLAIKSLHQSTDNRVKIFASFPDSPFYSDSLRQLSLDEKLLGDIYLETFNYKSAWQVYRKSLMREFPGNENHVEQVTLSLAKTYEAAGEFEEAADGYALLLKQSRSPDLKQSAIEFFQENENILKNINVDLTAFKSTINRMSGDSGSNKASAIPLIVDAYENPAVRDFYTALNSNKFFKIIETGRRVLAQYPGIREAKGVDQIVKSRIILYLENNRWMSSLDPVVDLFPARDLSNMGLRLWKKKRSIQAAVFYKRIINRYPLETELCHKALYFLGRIYEDLEDYPTSLGYYHLLLEKYDFGAFSTAVRFKIPWIERIRGQHAKAKFHFDQLILFYDSADYKSWKVRYPSYDTFHSATVYWSARNESSLGNETGRVMWLEKLITDFPLNFYSTLARWELEMGLDDFIKSGIDVNPLYRSTGLGEIDRKRLSRAERLVAVGFFDIAEMELMRINLNNDKIEFKAYLARLLHLAHGFQSAISLNWSILQENGGEQMSGALARGLFPNAWLKPVEIHAKRYNLDPWFVLSLMRQESAFNASIVSSANAYGLMQLLPATALDVADSLNIELTDEAILKDPDMNVKLGVNYLNRLLNLFDGNAIHALAAYNAGDHKVREWLETRRNMGVVEFVESIPYNETRNYVKKIIRNYSIYLALYKRENVLNLNDLLTNIQN